MKKRFLFLLFSIFALGSLKAQLPNGSQAPDWILTDLNGNTHHLQEYLDAGKTVYIDMFATWCGPCWNYHQTHTLKNLYEQYGPDGTDQVMVFGIESDISTPTNCLYDQNCPSSQGDWTAGVPYPIIDITATNGPNMPNNYALSYYPTIYGICPNGQITEVSQVGLATLVNFMNNCPQPPPLAMNYQVTDIHCSLSASGAINLSVFGGKSPYTYAWSTGATTQNLSNVPTGTYSCLITDSKGDQITTGNITVDGPTSLISIASQEAIQSTCEQSNGSVSVSATGGDPGYTYSWSNGASTPSINNLFAGTYSVNIVDAEGCSVSASLEVYNIPSPTVLISDNGQQLSCTNPSLVISSAGSSTGTEYTYSWTTSNGLIISDPLLTNITVGAPGLYVLTIYNTSLGCFNANFIQINGAVGLPIANAGSNEYLPCSGGEVSLSGSASSTGNNYTYLWTTTDGNILTDPTAVNIDVDQSGTYVLHVTNTTNGCVASDETVVEVDNNVNVTSSVSQIQCNGAANGSITINETNYNYTWSNGATTSSIEGLSVGSYQVTITNNAGCVSTQSFSITQPVVLTSTFSGTEATSANSNDGTITANPSGGTGPYTYVWSSGQTTKKITGLSPGSYSVIITDAHGCSTQGAYAINVQGCTLSAAPSVTNASCYGAQTGSVTLDLSNVTGTPSILWNTGATSATLEDVSAGSYSATIQDEAGCLTVVNVIISQPDEIALSAISSNGPQCPQDETGTIEITAEGGSGTFTYLWNNGSTESSIDGLSAGIYTVAITDGSGCSTSKEINLKSQDTEKPSLKLKTTEIAIEANGIALLDFPKIDDGSSDNCSDFTVTMVPSEFDCSSLGVQSVEVTLIDGSGNKTIKTVDVTVIDNTAPSWNNCPSGEFLANSCSGLVDLDLSYNDNCTEVLFEQIKGLALDVEFPLGNTSQEYVIIDASGNQNTCAFNVHRDLELQLNATHKNSSCNLLGSIEVTPDGGSNPISYEWENGYDGSKQDVQPGTYLIIVTDGSGCAKETSITIDGPYVYSVENSEVVTPQLGSNDGTIGIELNGPSDDLTFAWTKDGVAFASTEDISDLESGIYVLNISDANGCTFGPYTYDLTPSSVYDANFTSKLSVYPNPTADVLTVKYDGKESQMFVQIIDVLGRRVSMNNLNLVGGKVQISTQSLSNGTYRMIFDNGSKVAVKQFVVIK